MNHAEAQEEASRRNHELGRQAVDDRYWIEVELPSGEWTLECRRVPKSVWRKIWDALMASPGP